MILEFGFCVEKTLPTGCDTLTDAGDCKCCAVGFYLNPSLNSCLPVTSSIPQVSNCTCQEFNQCKVCDTGFINQNGVCIAYNLLKNTCYLVQQNAQAQCAVCKEGFFLNASGVCQANAKVIENCDYSRRYENRQGYCFMCTDGTY